MSETKSGNLIEAHSHNGTTGKQLYEFTNIEIDNLLDLTDANTIKKLGTTIEQIKLTKNATVTHPYEYTQEIAIWAKNNGYNGIKFYGTQGNNTLYINYVIFKQSIVDNAVKGNINPIKW